MKIPKEYKLIAVSVLLGTGEAEARAYFHPSEKKVIFTIFDPSTGFSGKIGPLEPRVIPTLEHIFKDVGDMKGKPLAYIEE